ncbi:MAG: glycosyltransferase [Kiritimatiellae bacterium]|nr:glycosyltransferase [Kiritimatiellia bacterium]
MPVLHQLVAGFRRGDAISDEAMLIRDVVSSHGMAADIRCPLQYVDPNDRREVADVETLAGEVSGGDIALLHLSIGSRANEVFRSLPCRRIILYHNVTPPHFFERVNPSVSQILANGREQVASLRNAAHANWAVSRFNAGELERMGYRDVRVLPLILPDTLGKRRPGRVLRPAPPRDSFENFIFVGRLAPNKRHDRLLSVFSAYQKYVNPKCRLSVLGGSGGAEAYKTMLLGYVHAFELKNVVFTDFIDNRSLDDFYSTASAFVCMSEHEGFCAPLLEAMAWRIPVFALRAGAVPETLDGAGVLFDSSLSHEEMAEAIGAVLGNRELREAVLKKQDERLARFRRRDVWAEVAEMLGTGA